MKKASDWLGVFASTFCALHCTVAPLFVGMTSLDWIQMPGWDYVFVILSVFAMIFSMNHIHQPILKFAFPLGFLVLIVGLLQEELHILGIPVHIIGSLLLISMHIWNLLSPHHSHQPSTTSTI